MVEWSRSCAAPTSRNRKPWSHEAKVAAPRLHWCIGALVYRDEAFTQAAGDAEMPSSVLHELGWHGGGAEEGCHESTAPSSGFQQKSLGTCGGLSKNKQVIQ